MTSFFSFVETMISGDRADALSVAAATSFLKAMRKHPVDEVSADSVSLWIIAMAMDGLNVSTRKKYFSRLHSIWKEWTSTPGDNPFEAARSAVDADFQLKSDIADFNLNRLLRLINHHDDAPDKESVDMLLYLLYNPSATIEDVINLKFNDTPCIIPQIDDIIERRKKLTKRSRNVFGLGQGRKRTPQLVRETVSRLQEQSRRIGMKAAGEFTRQSVTAIWIAAALRAGIPVADIRSLITSIPAEYPSLSLVPALPITERDKAAILLKVADTIDNSPAQWFVMRMRPGQNPDSVKLKIDLAVQSLLQEIVFYYPTRRELRITPSGKRVNKEVPFLPGILFFKLRRDKVQLLMSRIGEVGWCYKYVNSAESRYCVIPNSEMREFQRHIGRFSPDIRLDLITLDEPLPIGSQVMISGGGMLEGHIGRIQSFKNDDGTRTYTLALSDKDYATWTVTDIEEIFIEPLNDKAIG